MVLEAHHQPITAQEFDDWVDLPENNERLFELISGEIIEKMPSNAFSSMIASRIIGFLMMYLFKNDIGYVTTEQGGYEVGDGRYAPDVALVMYAKQRQPNKKGYNTVAPDLAVEVISDADNREELTALRRKVTGYLNAGVIVWIVDCDKQTVEVHQLGQDVKILGVADTIDVAELLPDFKLAVRDIFPAEKA
ncbi:MAG TPA: Uma2 family endonuclease [Aggregatilineales bacterium]|nr:Uma2 family endonuclease [Aggregatilineales bacterium]